jgi:uncharacterized protein YodC (DUF2158 family)
MSKTQFTTGDIVQLRSGGPPITVGNVDDQKAECMWFDGGDLKTGIFRLEMLHPLVPRSEDD